MNRLLEANKKLFLRLTILQVIMVIGVFVLYGLIRKDWGTLLDLLWFLPIMVCTSHAIFSIIEVIDYKRNKTPL